MVPPVSSPSRASAPPSGLDAYDALLVLSFGGPEGHDEVLPFLERVTAGRGIPRERLLSVAEHYHRRGGVSPINALTRQLRDALATELGSRGARLPVVVANRHSAPFVSDVLGELAGSGARRLLVLLTSAYASYSSCRAYREALADAAADTAPDLTMDVVAPWFDVPQFAGTMARLAAERVRAALVPQRLAVLAVTHSIPVDMDATSGPPTQPRSYTRQHTQVAERVLAGLQAALPETTLTSELVFCSRSGPPAQPWLEPDVGDRIRELAAAGVRDVLLVPIGFVCDHMEVLNDLDEVAVGIGRDLGVRVLRSPTVGTDPVFVSGLVDAVIARSTHPACAVDCCVRPGRVRPGGPS